MSDRYQLKPKKRVYPDGIRLHRTLADGSIEYLESFISQEEMIKAMSVEDPATGKPYYETNAAFREAVTELINNTPAEVLGVQLEPRNPIPTNEEMLEGMRQDAMRQRYNEMVDKAGGNDAVAKYELARLLTDPNAENFEFFGEMNQLTQLDATRPMENFLKERRAAGLGPQRDTAPMESDEEVQAREDAHNKEILEWMASQEVDGDGDVGSGDEGVGI